MFGIKRNYVIKFVVNPKSVSFLLADAFFGLDNVHIVFIDLGYHQERKKMNTVELKIIENLRIKWISWFLCVENEIKLRERGRRGTERGEKRQQFNGKR